MGAVCLFRGLGTANNRRDLLKNRTLTLYAADSEGNRHPFYLHLICDRQRPIRVEASCLCPPPKIDVTRAAREQLGLALFLGDWQRLVTRDGNYLDRWVATVKNFMWG